MAHGNFADFIGICILALGCVSIFLQDVGLVVDTAFLKVRFFSFQKFSRTFFLNNKYTQANMVPSDLESKETLMMVRAVGSELLVIGFMFIAVKWNRKNGIMSGFGCLCCTVSIFFHTLSQDQGEFVFLRHAYVIAAMMFLGGMYVQFFLPTFT